MDLNPTFGHQELLETLSQKSASSTKSTNTANHNAHSKQVNEAVRRLGYRLSVQAHGGDIRNGGIPSVSQQPPPPPIRRMLDHSVGQSGFASLREYNKLRAASSSVDGTEPETDINNNNNNQIASLLVRTSKVAKTHYSDHGEHSSAGTTPAPKLKITRKLTLNCKECFRNWEETQRHVISAANSSPAHHFSLEPLALSGSIYSANNNKATSTMRNNMRRQKDNHHPLIGSRHELLPPSLEEEGYEDEEDGSNVDSDDHQKQQLTDDLVAPSNHSHMSSSQGSHSAAAAAAKRGKARLSVHTGSPGTNRSNKSLLSAVLEAESTTSVTSNSDHQKQQRQQHQSQQQQQQQLYKHGDESAASQSISTKDSKTTGSYGIPPQPPSAHHKPRHPERNEEQENDARWARGKCLTTPSEAMGNGGLDNVEGNLIVYENDSIIVARRNMRTIQRSRQQQQQRISKNSDNSHSNAPTAEFRIQGLQGQGTFAQVFQCLHVQTGKLVAVKIIKNKAVYTRQAAIEIDIFQTLQQEETTRQSIPTEAATMSSKSSSYQQQRQKSIESSAQTNRNNLDYMVNLDFYFMHQNHLCLVFELLGLNLYEVLKRRQFRGLPLSMVRDIVKQVVEGCRDLSQKNVVHCDLKPENILLLSKEANISVVAAGDARSRLSDRSSSVVGGCGGSTEGDGRDGSTMSSNEAKPQPSTSTNSHATTVPTCNTEKSASKVKIIDFGSACFEGYTAHTYIQSRFYRSPEVLMGLPYDSAIDMWSLGCVAAELFLGLPILPGVHEHDQLVRIAEMVASIPEWMVDQGSKSTKYFVKYVPRPSVTNGDRSNCNSNSNDPSLRSGTPSSGGGSLPLPQWRLKTQQEYISSLSQASIQKKGGIEKLNKQPGTRYFKQTKLSDILFLQAQQSNMEERELIPAFVHFLYGILDPDPWKRWTAFQASQHPFVTGNLGELRPKVSNVVMDPKEENQANLEFDMYWPSPWDPAICRRKLLNVQKMREKQQSLRRPVSSRSHQQQQQKSAWMGGDSAMLSAGRGGVGLDTVPLLMGGQQQQQQLLQQQQQQQQQPQQHREPSPPMQISPSNSTSGSHAGMAVSVGESSGFVAPMSWHRQTVQTVNTPQLAFGNGSQINDNHSATISAAARHQYYGAQSLQGGMGYTPTDVDFGQALMRPGVIPGSYGMGTSVASQSTAASFQVGNSSQNFLYGGGHAFFQDGTPRGMLSTQGGPLFESYLSGVPGQVPQEEPFRGMTSATSSVTMTDAASHAGDPRQIDFLAQQKQQLAFLQQQQIMQQSFQQHQQFALQQPMLASGPGGFYYVTTSSTGQPILLQPVGLLNQQGVGGQMFMNGQPGGNQQQGVGGQVFMNGQPGASQQGLGGQIFMNGQPGATQQLQNLNQQLYGQQQVMHNPQQMQNGPPTFSGIQQPQQQMYQQGDQQLYIRQQQQQPQQPPPPPQPQQQQRYVAPRDQHRHERGGGTSY